MKDTNSSKVRIDKWLWAARFYKTRSLAKNALENGKVKSLGQRIKASRDITIGTMLTIKIGWDDREIEVIALSDQRRGAPEAQLLYKETIDSITKREKQAGERKLFNNMSDFPPKKPTKKQRRQIHRFREQDL
ncbi:ribosome-associated heat shock protein Hsp15 [Aurantivibrio infirmus]